MPAKQKPQAEPASEFDAMLSSISKERGEIIIPANKIPQANHIPTGAFMLDYALLGGIPEGYASMFYGYESCLDGDTFIPYQVVSDSGKQVNTKGGSIKTLWARFHDVPYRGCRGAHRVSGSIFVLSVNHDNGIVRNEVIDVVKTGRRACFEITVNGQTIIATAEHKFLTVNGYRKLGSLGEGDLVFMHFCESKGRNPYPARPTLHVRNHPYWPEHVVSDGKGNSYTYKRGQASHAYYEAHINGLSVPEYVDRLNLGQIKGLKFIPEGSHIHHIDENWLNNDPNNLMLVSPSEHGRIHADDCANNTRYVAKPYPVEQIVSAGYRETFDIKCAWPFNNYVANKFVVHNSGKTMLSKKTVAGYQRKHPDKQVVWIDVEGMFDKDWALALGCELDRLHVVRPTSGNEAVDMIESLMEPKEVGMVVLDSIPGCVPMRIIEKSAEDQTMGELARLMGIMCSKILVSWANERKRNHWVTFLSINQWRSKIGVMFGDPRTLPGGRQINHLPTTKIELKNNEIGGKDTFDSNMMIRNEHAFKITKAKHGRSVREGEFHMSLSEEANNGVEVFGFVNHKTVVAYAKKMGILTGGGASGYRFSIVNPSKYSNSSFRTLDAAGEFLIEHPREMEAVQRHLISMQRVDKGLSALPLDGYLVGPTRNASRKVCR